MCIDEIMKLLDRRTCSSADYSCSSSLSLEREPLSIERALTVKKCISWLEQQHVLFCKYSINYSFFFSLCVFPYLCLFLFFLFFCYSLPVNLIMLSWDPMLDLVTGQQGQFYYCSTISRQMRQIACSSNRVCSLTHNNVNE